MGPVGTGDWGLGLGLDNNAVWTANTIYGTNLTLSLAETLNVKTSYASDSA